MKKPYLLIAGDNLYPEGGTGNWIACYGTREEAVSQVQKIETPYYFFSGKRKGEVKGFRMSYKILSNGAEGEFDWYEIVDLREWTEG